MITVSNYKIESQIYTSDNSCVYRGYRQPDGAPVVLKILQAEYPTALQLHYFQQEYEIVRGLKLPGVVQVYGLEKVDHTQVLIMEDFGGQSLTQLGLAGQLTLTEFLQLAIRLSEILGQIHQAGVMHKDINPANIVLNPATNELKLIDFGLASRLAQEYITLSNPHQLAGTLAYLAPEQTGRMNRLVDYRSDLYALGMTFYELLVGQLPFLEHDPLALVHAHIAQTPTPPHYLRANIPPMLSEIVLKLVAKNAEDRYQSAFGLQRDLAECLRQWTANTKIEPFILGQHDQSGRFQLPQRLYGREAELRQLTEIIDRVADGGVELVWITGYSGVGKSALVQELHQTIMTRGGQFVTGRFDSYKQDLPYSALLQALAELVNYVRPEDLAEWQARILQAVGHHGLMLLRVVPTLAEWFGGLLPASHLTLLENQNRFNYALQRFIQVVATPTQPLVLFLDNLQWADEASLNLLVSLFTHLDLHHVLVIGAYRNNEVEATHLLTLKQREILALKVRTTTIVLKNLRLPEVQAFIAATLESSDSLVAHLAELIQTKTEGNVFFVRQFLQLLYERGLISFNYELQQWQWDISKIGRQSITDNVVALLVTKLRKLPAVVQEALKVAACLGQPFELEAVAAIMGLDAAIVLQQLKQAIEQRLIVPDAYWGSLEAGGSELKLRFAHDHIQQAAYALIAPEQQAHVHWRVGQILWARTPDLGEQVFDLVNHLNRGREFMTHPADLATLNLMAARKAKETSAYTAAAYYLDMGIAALTEQGWQTNYDLMVELYCLQGEVRFLLGQPDQAAFWLDQALTQATSLQDKTRVYVIQMTHWAALGQYKTTLRLAQEALRQLGVAFPETDADLPLALEAEMAIYRQTMAGRSIESLAALPEMTDKTLLLGVEVMGQVGDTLMVAFPQRLPLYAYKAVNLALQFGVSKDTPLNFAFMALAQILLKHDFVTAVQFIQVAEKLQAQYPNLNSRHKLDLYRTMNQILEQGIPFGEVAFRQGYLDSLERGDWVYAAYYLLGQVKCWLALDLGQVVLEVDFAQAFLNRSHNTPMVWLMQALAGFALNLQGRTPHQVGLDYAEFSVKEYEHLWAELPLLMISIKQLQLQNLALWGEYELAWPWVKAREVCLSQNIDGFVWADYHFYSGLVAAARGQQTPQSDYQDILADCVTKLSQFASTNLAYLFFILKAEQARLLGQVAEAMQCYHRGIEEAKAQGVWQYQAVGNELAARFYLAQGIKMVAGLHFREADYAYRRWGATAKAKTLRAQQREFFLAISTSYAVKQTITPHVTSSWAEEQLDFATIVKASQAISQELDLTQLLMTLLKLVLENAGAQKAALILKAEGQLQVMAAANEEMVVYQPPQNLEVNRDIAVNIVNYVAQTHIPLILDEATRHGHFVKDPYVLQYQPKSVLCLPLLQQGQLKGLLYLENNLAHHVFTPERVKVIELLGTQAIISISNVQVMTAQAEQARLALQKDVIYRTTNLLSASTHLPDLLQSVTHDVAAALPAHAVSLIICDISQQKVTHFVVGGVGGGLLEVVSYEELQGGLTGWVLREQQPVLSLKGGRDERENEAAYQRRLKQGVGSIIVVPIHYGEQVLGTMTALNRQEERDFQTKEVELMVALASQVAVAITQATLYRDLEASERKYRAIFEDSYDMIFISSLDGQVLAVNPVCETLLGYTQNEMLQLNALVLYANPSERQRFRDAVNQNGSVKDFEVQLRRKEGQVIDVLITATWRKNEQGQLVGYQGIVRDITATKQAAEALKRSEAEYRQLVEQANSIIMKWDMAGKITFVNKFGLQFFGYTEAELLGQPLQITLPSRQQAGRNLQELVADILAQPQDYLHHENENVTKEGRSVWVIWSNQLIHDMQGQPVGVLSIGNDNTAQHETENMLKDYNQRLEQQGHLRAVELEQRMRELTVLNHITQIVSVVADIEAMWQAVAREINELFQSQSCTLSFFDDAKTELHITSVCLRDGQPSPVVGVTIPLILSSELTHHLIDLGQSVVIPDPQTHPATTPIHAVLQARQAQTILVSPLRTHNDILGTITLMLDQVGRKLTLTEISLLETIAGQVATAIENYRLFVAEQQQRQLAEALREVAQILTSTLNQEQVLAAIFEQLGRVVQYDSGAVFLRDLDELVLVKQFNLADHWVGRQIALTMNTPTVKVFHEQRYSILADVRLDPTWLIWPDTPDVRSWMGVPLLVGQEAIGVLTVDNWQVGAYREGDAQTVQLFANQAAIAIRNARQAAQIEEALHETQLLYRVGNLLTKSLDPQMGVEKAVGECLWALGVGQGSLALFEPDLTFERLYVSYYDDAPEPVDLLPQKVPLIHQQVAQEGRPISIVEAMYDPLLADRYDEMRGRGVQSLLVNPLLARGQVIGVLELAEIEQERAFTLREITLVKMVADQIASAIEQYRLVSQAEEARELAEKANQAKSIFLARMSHELRTPLNAVLGFSQLMQRDKHVTAEQAVNLERINRSGKHLLSLINDVLEMSKIEAGQVTLAEVDFDLFHLLDDVRLMLQLRAREKRVMLVVERDLDVPRYIHADQIKLRQVLVNLLNNALKYTEHGSIQVRVKLRSVNMLAKRREKSSPFALDQSYFALYFEVEDTGQGISQEEQATLFNPFVQTESGRQVGEGTGLGLSISRGFVRLMGGNLEVRSQWGQGSCFFFDMLARLAKGEVEPAAEPLKKVMGLKPGQPIYRLLVVEDKLENRELLINLLKSVGLVVAEARNGLEAVDLWASWQPHLIFMDIHMPFMDGYEATRRIREQDGGQECIIIAITASVFEEERAKILAVGCNDVVLKPFQFQVIWEKLAQYLKLAYIYSDEIPLTSVEQVETLPILPIELPPELRSRLEEAAISGNITKLSELVEEIRLVDKTLAGHLAHHVENFDYEEILRVLATISAE